MPAPSLLDDSLSLLRDHLSVLLPSAAFLVTAAWIAARAFYVRQTTMAEKHRDYVEAQLKDAKERLKELAPQSQATDLAGLLDDLTRKLTTTAEAGEALSPNRLVHIAQEAEGRSVVLLADKVKRLEAHGFVTRFCARGEEVRIERMGQFPLTFTPTDRHIFLATQGRASNYAGDTPNTISQQVGTLGPENVCLFHPAAEVEFME